MAEPLCVTQKRPSTEARRPLEESLPLSPADFAAADVGRQFRRSSHYTRTRTEAER